MSVHSAFCIRKFTILLDSWIHWIRGSNGEGLSKRFHSTMDQQIHNSTESIVYQMSPKKFKTLDASMVWKGPTCWRGLRMLMLLKDPNFDFFFFLHVLILFGYEIMVLPRKVSMSEALDDLNSKTLTFYHIFCVFFIFVALNLWSPFNFFIELINHMIWICILHPHEFFTNM